MPFHTLFNNKSARYAHFGDCPPFFPTSVHCGEIPSQQSLVLVTGCSSNHFCATLNCLYSMLLFVPNASVVFVDYGLSTKELFTLSQHFIRLSPRFNLFYRKFNFVSFPAWMHISTPTMGGYAWKVISYTDIAMEHNGEVGWIDGGCRVVDDLHGELEWMRHDGLFSVYSSGTIGDWIDENSLSFLLKSGIVKSVNRSAEMCSGGYVFLDAGNRTRIGPILDGLVKCAYTKRCMDPVGTTRKNFRQDQSILTLLIHDASIPRSCDSHFHVNTLFHQDSVAHCS